MTEAKSPQRWAYELTQVLNAVFGPERFPVDVAALARDYTAQLYPDDPVSVVKGDDLPGFDGALYPDPHGRKGWAIIYNDCVASKGRINFTLRTSGRPVHIPSGSLAAQEDRGAEGRDGIELPPGVWFSNEEAREMVVFSEQYEFVISLLLLQDHPPFYMVEEEPIKDAFDHLTGRL